jgi:hypothetical protein
MLYPYNAIFERGLLNAFEASLDSGYLYLKIPATYGVICIFGSQQDARNIEKGRPITKTCIFREKSHNNIRLQHATLKQKLRQNTRKPSKLMTNSKKSP